MNPLRELTVRDLMTSPPVVLESPDASIQDALDLMNQHRVGGVVILDQTRLVGIFTERDFLKHAADPVPGWRTIPIREWMSPSPYSIDPNTNWEQAVESMQRLRIRHLPVVEANHVIGIVTSKALIANRANYLDQIVLERTREVRRANDSLLSREAEVNHYMKVAGRLQRAIVLPQDPPDWPGIHWAVHYAPLDPLGGDFYDYAQIDKDHLGLLIADASGHSIPAALVAIMARYAFTEVSGKSISPGEVLGKMNERLQNLVDERYVTAFYGILNRQTRVFKYANAGHPFPLQFRGATGEIVPLSARGFPLGISPDERYREKEVHLEPGDRLCLYTDGIPDVMTEMGESFGTSRVQDYLREYGAETSRQLVDGLLAQLTAFRGERRPSDDMTLVLADIQD
jgi:phosphoserine phosphatase RsbU/P